MYKNRSRGFTLIELLVVIAVIGILSAVVLASLNIARSKGNDAAVQANLTTIQTQTEIYFGGAGVSTYGSVLPVSGSCTTAGTMFMTDMILKNTISSAEAVNGSSIGMVCNVAADSTAYAVSSPLTSMTGYWCIDSAGFSGKRTTPLGTNTVCPAT